MWNSILDNPIVNWGSSFLSGGGGAASAASSFGADGWGSGVAESVGITASTGADGTGWWNSATASSLGQRALSSLASGAASTARAQQQSRISPNEFRVEGPPQMPFMQRPQRRESQPAPVAPNPFSARHPLAGWMRGLSGMKDD